MIRRLLALLLVGVLGLAGLALAQEPPAKEEPAVRLKKKKPRGEDKPKVEPDKPDEKKKDDDKAEKKEDKKPEPREAEPVTPQEEEKEVLQRVVKNVHNVGERLAKNDLGEATQQTQRDILKDLESLIQRNENPPQGDDEQNDNPSGGGGGSKSKGKRGSKKLSKRAGGKSSSRTGSGSQAMSKSSSGQGQQGGKDGKNGNGGGGGNKDDRARNRAADQYKDIWGHLPQTLRAQMDAYSNPQPFMPKYDDVIKQYYRTIAEQGRRKGE